MELNSTFTGQLKNQLFKTLKIFKFAKWSILILSLGGMAASVYIYFKKSSKEVSITPVRKTTSQSDKDNEISNTMQNDVNGYTNKAMTGREFDRY